MKTTIFTIVFILITGWLMFQPTIAGKSQDSLPKQPSIESLKSKDASLNRKQDAQLETLADFASEPNSKPRVIYKIRKVREVKTVLASDQKILLRVNGGNIYETEPELYMGNVMIDIYTDTLLTDLGLRAIPISIMPASDSLKKKTDNRSGLRKVIDRINPFK